MQKVHIRFPGISCCVCGEGLQGQEACIHPTERGPQGGKRYCHEHCLNGSTSYEEAEGYGMEMNPFMGHNPFMEENAGRRTFRGAQKPGRLPRRPAAERRHAQGEWISMTVEELVSDGSAGAKAELRRRDRDTDGIKLAWKQPRAKKAAPNPYGFDY